MTRARAVALGVALVVGAAACGDDDDSAGLALSDDSVIEYHYGDSSVPPEYHRSYTLTIQKDEVHVVVDSYGDVLQDTTVPLPGDVWDELADTAAVETLDGMVEHTDDGCSGGTSRSITVDTDGETQLATDFSVCDSNDEAARQLDGYVQPVIDAVPDWDTLLD